MRGPRVALGIAVLVLMVTACQPAPSASVHKVGFAFDMSYSSRDRLKPYVALLMSFMDASKSEDVRVSIVALDGRSGSEGSCHAPAPALLTNDGPNADTAARNRARAADAFVEQATRYLQCASKTKQTASDLAAFDVLGHLLDAPGDIVVVSDGMIRSRPDGIVITPRVLASEQLTAEIISRLSNLPAGQPLAGARIHLVGAGCDSCSDHQTAALSSVWRAAVTAAGGSLVTFTSTLATPSLVIASSGGAL